MSPAWKSRETRKSSNSPTSTLSKGPQTPPYLSSVCHWASWGSCGRSPLPNYQRWLGHNNTQLCAIGWNGPWQEQNGHRHRTRILKDERNSTFACIQRAVRIIHESRHLLIRLRALRNYIKHHYHSRTVCTVTAHMRMPLLWPVSTNGSRSTHENRWLDTGHGST